MSKYKNKKGITDLGEAERCLTFLPSLVKLIGREGYTLKNRRGSSDDRRGSHLSYVTAHIQMRRKELPIKDQRNQLVTTELSYRQLHVAMLDFRTV